MVGRAVGAAVGRDVGAAVGAVVGGDVGAAVGGSVGAAVGGSVGAAVGGRVGASVGTDVVGIAVGARLGIAVAGAADAASASARAVGSGDGDGLRITIVAGAGDPVGEIFESSGLRGTPRKRCETGRAAAAATAATAGATTGATRDGRGAAVGSTRRTILLGVAEGATRSRVTRVVSTDVVSAMVDESASGALLDDAPMVRIAKKAPMARCTRSDNTSATARRRPYRSRRARDGVMLGPFAHHASYTSCVRSACESSPVRRNARSRVEMFALALRYVTSGFSGAGMVAFVHFPSIFIIDRRPDLDRFALGHGGVRFSRIRHVALRRATGRCHRHVVRRQLGHEDEGVVVGEVEVGGRGSDHHRNGDGGRIVTR
jgi:hypothetical protein